MDGIKGSMRKGTKALDRLAVVWRAVGEGKGVVVAEPREGQEVPETKAADWKGAHVETEGLGKNLGLRTESPVSADVSRAGSIKSGAPDSVKESEDSTLAVKTYGLEGEEKISHERPATQVPDATQSDPELGESSRSEKEKGIKEVG